MSTGRNAWQSLSILHIRLTPRKTRDWVRYGDGMRRYLTPEVARSPPPAGLAVRFSTCPTRCRSDCALRHPQGTSRSESSHAAAVSAHRTSLPHLTIWHSSRSANPLRPIASTSSAQLSTSSTSTDKKLSEPFTADTLREIRSRLRLPPSHHPTQAPSHTVKYGKQPSEAAVLIPLINIDGRPHVLLEKRSEKLRVHAAEVR